MAKTRKGLSTTRNKEFNSYIDKIGDLDFVHSITNITATKKNPNIKLLDYNDYIKKSGTAIADDAKKNSNCDALNKRITYIDTSNLVSDNDYLIYGSPDKWVFDNRQQYCNCGADSVLNVLVMAGKMSIKNQNSTETSFTKQLWNLGLVDDDGKLAVFDIEDGGSNPTTYQEIFEYYGLESEAYASPEFSSVDLDEDHYSISLHDVANIVRSGGTMIVAVCSDLLWQRFVNDIDIDNIDYSSPDVSDYVNNYMLDHAVTITGVVYESDNSTIAGFYIHDTGVWMTRYISYAEMQAITFDNVDNLDYKTKTGVFGTVIEDVKQYDINLNATGNNLDNIIYGNSGDNVIKGVAGTNTLVGGAGNDTIYGGKGDDTIYGNDKKKDGGSSVGRNILNGGAGEDVIYGGNYNDTITGGSGNDYLFGNDGTDAISGGKGSDTIYGGNGDDRLLGDAGEDYIHGGAGHDTIIGGAGNDHIYGEAGNDKIECGSGKDHVYFERDCGADLLSSSSGSVQLHFTNEFAKYLKYKLDNGVLSIDYDDNNGVNFKGFYNSGTNKSKTTYLVDGAEETYRVSATKSGGNIKVADSKSNNILFTEGVKNNTITTSDNSDIVFMLYGDDKITYTGGKDYYYSSNGNDKYIVNSFHEYSCLHINDAYNYETVQSSSTNDSLSFNARWDNMNLLFDVDISDGTVVAGDLFIVNDTGEEAITSTYLKNVINDETTGFVKVDDYFGNGKIETVSTLDKNINIDDYVSSLTSNISAWLSNHGQTSAFEAIKDNVSEVSDLIAYYGFTTDN